MSIIYINSYQFAPAAPIGDDPDALDYIARVESADGQTLEAGVRAAYNTFFAGCKTDGTFSALKASCMLAGARSLAGALTPLTSTMPTPTNNGFIGIGTDYDRKTGLIGDGTSKFLDSGRSNAADPQNSKHIAAYATTGGTRNVNRALIGQGVTGAGNSHIVTTTTQRIIRVNYSTNPTISDTTALAGLEGASRFSASEIVYRYGGTSTTYASTSTTPTTSNIRVYARGNATASDFSNARLAFYSIGEHVALDLLEARVAALINALAAAIP